MKLYQINIYFLPIRKYFNFFTRQVCTIDHVGYSVSNQSRASQCFVPIRQLFHGRVIRHEVRIANVHRPAVVFFEINTLKVALIVMNRISLKNVQIED